MIFFFFTSLLDLLWPLWVLVAHEVQVGPENAKHNMLIKAHKDDLLIVNLDLMTTLYGSQHHVLTLTGGPGAPDLPLSPSTPT